MKKLLTLAAIVVAGSAFAACSFEPETIVYKWKFTGKTTMGKPVKIKTSGKSVCGWDPGSGNGDCPVRAPASLKIEGYTAMCESDCGSIDFESFAEANEIFWQKKPFKASLAGGVATDVSNVIGKKGKQFEAAGTAKFDQWVGGSPMGSYTLTYAGLGKYDTKHRRVKSVKGNFAGYLDQPYTIGNAKAQCVPAGIWDCPVENVICDAGTSVAFGKWSAKFKKSTSKKYNSKGEKALKIPSWAKKMNK